MNTLALIFIIVGSLIVVISFFGDAIAIKSSDLHVAMILLPIIGLAIIGIGLMIQADTTAFAWLAKP